MSLRRGCLLDSLRSLVVARGSAWVIRPGVGPAMPRVGAVVRLLRAIVCPPPGRGGALLWAAFAVVRPPVPAAGGPPRSGGARVPVPARPCYCCDTVLWRPARNPRMPPPRKRSWHCRTARSSTLASPRIRLVPPLRGFCAAPPGLSTPALRAGPLGPSPPEKGIQYHPPARKGRQRPLRGPKWHSAAQLQNKIRKKNENHSQPQRNAFGMQIYQSRSGGGAGPRAQSAGRKNEERPSHRAQRSPALRLLSLR